METKTKIFTKLLEFQNSVEVIKKDGKNEFFKKASGKASTYATLPKILAEVKPILNALKIVVTQPIINGEVYTTLTDTESGEQESSSVAIPLNLNAQQVGSAITYFRRYTLSSLLSLEIDEDDDGNKASEPPVFVDTTSDKPYLNEFEKDGVTPTANWAAVTKAITKDGFTIAQVELKYKLSKDTKARLIQIQNTGS